jgi:hypothetical protein
MQGHDAMYPYYSMHFNQLIHLNIATAFSFVISIAKGRSIAVSIGLKRHIVGIVIGACPQRRLLESEAG